MRTPPHTTNSIDPMDDCDDIFGPPRPYPIAYVSRNRPSMISAKYKQKEERRKVLKISLNKLKKIDDPDTNLRRSVLINNTMKRLQQETRDEKLQKQQLSYPRCYSNDSYLNIKSEFLRNEKALEVEEIDTTFTNSAKIEEIVIENDFHARLEEEINNVSSTGINSLSDIGASDFPSPSVVKDDYRNSKKRPFEEPLDESDIQEVFSQLYIPPLDVDDQEEADPLAKRLKLEEDHQFSLHPTDSLISQTTYTDYTKSVTSFINNNIPSSRFSSNCVLESDSSSFSCGQASMFGEMQTNVYHNLIASLET